MNKTSPLFESTEQPSRSRESLAESRIGPYVLHRLLGRGGMGEVYEASDDKGKKVALKLLDPELSRNPQFKSIFLHEIVHLSRCHHPGLVGFVDSFFSTLGTLVLVMEYVDGQTLRSRLHAMPGRRLPLEQVVGMGIQVANAVGSLHALNIVHGDLKPENLMMIPGRHEGEPEAVKVIDFGIARSISRTGLSTSSGHDFGSPPYQAPEQRSARICTYGADVYALGILLHEAAAGHPPLIGEADPFSLSQELPQVLRDLMRRMLASDPADRPVMSEVESALEELARTLIPSRITPFHWEKAHASGQDVQPLSSKGTSIAVTRKKPPARIRKVVSAVLMAGTVAALLGLMPRLRNQLPGVQPSSPPPGGMSLITAGLCVMGSTPQAVEAAYRQCLAEACQQRKQCTEPNQECRMDSFEREQPQHRVLISHDFYVDNNLVTKGEWARFLNNLSPRHRVEPDRDTGKARFIYEGDHLIYDLHELRNDVQQVNRSYVVKRGREDQPVEQVTWIGAQSFCRFMGKELLSEAQWEYLKVNEKSLPGAEQLNMTPGLSEWVADQHRSRYESCQEPCADPVFGRDVIDPTKYRVVRGCSRADLPIFCRATARGYQKADAAPRDIGFRCMTPISPRHSVQKMSVGCAAR